MIFKILYDFFRIASLPGSKNGQFGLGGTHEPHSAEDFLFVVPEKFELSEEERNDQDDDLIAKDQNQQTQSQSQFSVVYGIQLQPFGNASGDIRGERSCGSKGAKDQSHLLGGDFPFLLQAFKHGAKRRKKSTAPPYFKLLNLL